MYSEHSLLIFHICQKKKIELERPLEDKGRAYLRGGLIKRIYGIEKLRCGLLRRGITIACMLSHLSGVCVQCWWRLW